MVVAGYSEYFAYADRPASGRYGVGSTCSLCLSFILTGLQEVFGNLGYS
jgi:hypothetical protein